MNDTYVTVVGTALNTPEWRMVAKSGAIVANFKVASHARRYDKATDAWVDAPSLRVRVNCWRRLAEGVCASIIAGDPVVVYGRIATREWQNEQGETRIAYEVEADSVGHDLSRGQAKFKKVKLGTVSSVIEDADADSRVNGEVSTSVPSLNATRSALNSDAAFDDLAFGEGPAETDAASYEALQLLREAHLSGSGADGVVHDRDGRDDGHDEDVDDADEEELVGAPAGSGGPAGRSRRRGRAPVPA